MQSLRDASMKRASAASDVSARVDPAMDAMESVQAACEVEEDRARLAPEAERL